MHPASAAEALDRHIDFARDLLVKTIRYRHDRFAEAHVVSESRYGNGFGAQWRDLLDDTAEAFQQHAYQTHRLMPAGYKLPIVNNCLVYVWRVPDSSSGVEAFASSPTRINGFSAVPPQPMLFEPGPGAVDDATTDHDQQLSELTDALEEAAVTAMPLVLVAVQSSPSQLQKIEWGVAELNAETGDVSLNGRATLWLAELQTETPAKDVASFDSGVPTPPVLEPRKQEGTDPNAR